MKKRDSIILLFAIITIVIGYISFINLETPSKSEIKVLANQDIKKSVAKAVASQNIVVDAASKEDKKEVAAKVVATTPVKKSAAVKAAALTPAPSVSNSGLKYIPDIRTSPGSSQQVIVVLANSYGTYQAQFVAYEKVNETWQVVDSGRAVLGLNGFSDNRKEGDKTTPSGRYGFPFLFGLGSNPGFSMPYRVAGVGDYWASNTNLEEYNVWLHYDGPDPDTRLHDYEALWKQPLYKYAAVIDFNYGAGKIMGKGSGIFLHIAPYSGRGMSPSV